MDAFDRFVAHLRARDRAERTVDSYIRDLRAFARWFEQTNGEEFSPERVTPLDVREYRQHLVQRGRKPATVNRKLAALRVFFAWARREGLVSANPTEDIRLVPQVESPPRWLSRQEQYALRREVQAAVQLAERKTDVARFRARRDAACIALMLNAGLRVEEVSLLRMDDLELNARSGKVVVRKGKRGKYREVPLNAEVRKALRAYLEVRPETDEPRLFLSQTGQPLGTRAIQRAVERLARRAGLEGVTPHVLRHTFGKNLVDAGVSLDRVATLMGHSSLDTTAIYTRPGEQDLAQAVEKISWE